MYLDDVSIPHWKLQKLSFTAHPYQRGSITITLYIYLLRLFYSTG